MDRVGSVWHGSLFRGCVDLRGCVVEVAERDDVVSGLDGLDEQSNREITAVGGRVQR